MKLKLLTIGLLQILYTQSTLLQNLQQNITIIQFALQNKTFGFFTTYQFHHLIQSDIQVKVHQTQFPIPIGYKYIRTLGCGAFGIVYLVQNTQNKQLSCIKYLRHKTQKDVITFRKEVQAISKVQSDNVCKYIASGIRSQFSYLQMEYVRGVELQKLIDKHIKFRTDDLMDFMLHHKYHIIHRDIAPKNIIVQNRKIYQIFDIEYSDQSISDDETIYKLIDFGLAKCMSETLQVNYTIAATPNFCAHEIIEGNGYTCKSDIYSLGAICYLLITGMYPVYFNDIQDISKLQLKYQPYFNQLKTNSQFSHISLPLKELVINMLNYEPEKRPSAYDCMRILKEIAVDMKYKKNIPDVYNDDKITEFDTQE